MRRLPAVVVVVRDHQDLHLRRPIGSQPTCPRRKRSRYIRNDTMMLFLEWGQVEVLRGPTRLQAGCHGLLYQLPRRRNCKERGTRKLLVESELPMQADRYPPELCHHRLSQTAILRRRSGILSHTMLFTGINLLQETPVLETYPIKKL